MNRQYLEYIPEIGTPAANSHHGQQQQLHQQPGCKAANPSNHHDVKACSPWADHVRDSVCFEWEGKGELGLSLTGTGRNVASMRLNDSFGDRKAQPCAIRSRMCPCRIRTIKAVK